ncbi:hypothetical protein ACLX1H_006530 [Fusarium chlamydosporum]
MSTKRHILSLPPEIRQQIFGYCLEVKGGYIYDGNADKLRNANDGTPIDLSLLYTCRSIFNDCSKHLTLTVNTIHFSTLYRDDWRGLAGCFNLAATYHFILQQDLVLHLAHLITPEMHTQLEDKFPNFRAKLKAEREFHLRVWPPGDHGRSDEDLVDTDTSNYVGPGSCGFVQEFYDDQIRTIGEVSPSYYRGYAEVHRTLIDIPLDEIFESRVDSPDTDYRRWDRASGEVHRCLTHYLRIIADENPREFSNHVYDRLPHWVDKYPAEEFFNIQSEFEYWTIPSHSQVSNLLELLGIPDYVWKLPDMWSYDDSFCLRAGKNPSVGEFSEEFNNPTIDFTFRTREKIRFSAAASAIRFLAKLPRTQRCQIRKISLYEDLPAVNVMSLHGQGLVPFLKENPLLQVERRVSVVDCIMNHYGHTTNVENLSATWEVTKHIDESFIPKLSCWLLDALALADADIPPGSFTLFLESGPYADLCTESFQKLVHVKIAANLAWNCCLKTGMLQDPSSKQVKKMSCEHALENGFQEAVMQLVNQTSTILRCDFNPGLPESYQMIVDGMDDHLLSIWEYWGDLAIIKGVELPDHLSDRETLARICDIQSQDEYDQLPCPWTGLYLRDAKHRRTRGTRTRFNDHAILYAEY